MNHKEIEIALTLNKILMPFNNHSISTNLTDLLDLVTTM